MTHPRNVQYADTDVKELPLTASPIITVKFMLVFDRMDDGIVCNLLPMTNNDKALQPETIFRRYVIFFGSISFVNAVQFWNVFCGTSVILSNQCKSTACMDVFALN